MVYYFEENERIGLRFRELPRTHPSGICGVEEVLADFPVRSFVGRSVTGSARPHDLQVLGH